MLKLYKFLKFVFYITPRGIYNMAIMRPILSATIWLVLVLTISVLAQLWEPIVVLVVLLTGLFFLFRVRAVRSWRGRKVVHRNVVASLQDFLAPGYDLNDAFESIKAQDAASKRLKVSSGAIDGVYQLDFLTPEGRTDDEVIKQMNATASSLKDVVRWMPFDADPRYGRVSVVMAFTDPLEAHLDASAAPVLHLTDEEKRDPYHWLQIGIDSMGNPLRQPMFLKEGGAVRETSSGKSGTGKSSIFKQKLTKACVTPSIDVVLMDGKRSEFTVFAPYCLHYGTTVADFWEQLRLLQDECIRRGNLLAENKEASLKGLKPPRQSDAWNDVDDGNFIAWFWDELYTVMASIKATALMEAVEKIGGIATIARSLGIHLHFSSQNFHGSLLPPKIRDAVFDLHNAFQSGSLEESQYVGFTPSSNVRPDLIRGQMTQAGNTTTVGQFATHGLGEPQYGKSFYITDEQINRVLGDAVAIEASQYLDEVSKDVAADSN